MSSVKLNKFLKSKLDGVNVLRDGLNNDSLLNIEEDLVTLNAVFLKSHPDFEALPIDEIFKVLEDFVGKEINRE